MGSAAQFNRSDSAMPANAPQPSDAGRAGHDGYTALRCPKGAMRSFILLSPVLVGLLGCESSPQPKPLAFDPFHEKAIYAALKGEPVPLPQTTPYDGEARNREAFNEG